MKQNVIIVGGGLAGLACANRLVASGIEALILEASDAVGGRVRTDRLDGFLLDRGFQVFLSAYPEAGRLIDADKLDLRRFEPGALVFREGRRLRLMDVFRCPRYLFSTAIQPIGTLRDKWLVGKLRFRETRRLIETIAAGPDMTALEFLRRFGFSESMIDGFFRAFYGGIFLERDLRTSSRMFEFTFKMFAEGHATLPADGMEAIPKQLGDRLPPKSIQLNTPVQSVEPAAVTLEGGERIEADTVVVATDAESARRLLPGPPGKAAEWRSVTTLYFSAPRSPFNEAIIGLNGSATGLVNNVCVPSDLSGKYAPEGRALISVSVLGVPTVSNLEETVLTELREWFGDEPDRWKHLRTYRIRHALPEQPPGRETGAPFRKANSDSVYVCGDHCASASIEGAVVSGIRTAEAILETGARQSVAIRQTGMTQHNRR